MKKFISFVLFAILVFALSVTAFASNIIASGYCGGEGDGTNLEWTLDSDGVLIISGEGEMGNFSDIADKPWYVYYGRIKTLILEDGITTIGNNAFSNCGNLSGKLMIPNSVTYIGYNAFLDCDDLEGELVIPDSVTYIGGCAFEYCDFSSIKFGNGLETIGAYAFLFCFDVKGEILIPRSVTSIEAGAFSDCSANEYYFYGDAPLGVVGVGKGGITFDADDTIYYPEGNDTWEIVSGKWNGYTAVPWEVPFETGDINQDRKIDVKDVYPARLVAAKLVVPTEEELSLGDVDGDGKITAIDANLIRKFAAGIIDNFPVEV